MFQYVFWEKRWHAGGKGRRSPFRPLVVLFRWQGGACARDGKGSRAAPFPQQCTLFDPPSPIFRKVQNNCHGGDNQLEGSSSIRDLSYLVWAVLEALDLYLGEALMRIRVNEGLPRQEGASRNL